MNPFLGQLNGFSFQKKPLQDGIFSYYAKINFDRTAYTKKEKDRIKNSWMVIQNAVKFMKYFVDDFAFGV
jgi:hypothetical protein